MWQPRLAVLFLLFFARTAAAQISVPSSVQTGSQFVGSVRIAESAPGALALSMREAIALGLKANLGVLLTRETIRAAQGQRQQDLSALLPAVGAAATWNVQQLNIRAQEGIAFPGLPAIIGPFSYFDARLRLKQPVLDWQSVARVRASNAHLSAARQSYEDAREQVVLTVGRAYLETGAQAARVAAAEAQRDTARALYQQAQDQLKVGTTAAIDVLRAQVQLQVREQQVIAARTELAKQKLALARLIGLPLDRELALTDDPIHTPVLPVNVDNVLTRAYAARADHASLMSTVRAMELERQAAAAASYPIVSLAVDYGSVGVTPSSARPTLDGYASVSIPLFQGGRVRGAVVQAEAALESTRQLLEDLRGRIEQEVRTALLDLQSAADQATVAKSTMGLAEQTLQQARDRFSAGVADNIEIVQAQEAVASANEQVIVSEHAHHVALLELARAMGRAETGIGEIVDGK